MSETRPRLTAFARFVIGHMLAYVPGFLCAAAWIPRAIESQLAGLAATSDEAAVRALVMRSMIAPFLVGFSIPHLLLVPWVRAEDGVRGRSLLLVGTGLECLAASVFGAWAWGRLLMG